MSDTGWAKTAAGRAWHARYYQTWKQTPAGRASVERNRARAEGMRRRVNAIKVAAGCVDCGFAGHPAALEFDHIPERGDKVASISRLLRDSASWERLEAEMAKCEVRCANCHAVKSWERKK